MELFTQYPDVLIIIGIILITLEIVVFGFGTLFLIFIGFACFITALLMWFGILPAALLPALFSVALVTGLLAIVLWRPLRKLQRQQQKPGSQKNTLDGLSFRLTDKLTADKWLPYRYSGIDWQVWLDSGQSLEAGTLVKVCRADVGKLYVVAMDDFSDIMDKS